MMTQLKAARQEHGLTQEEIAKAAGLTARSYREYENGECPRSVAAAIRIARKLNTSVEKLFGT